MLNNKLKIRKKLVAVATLLALGAGFSNASADPVASTLLPYVQINVNELDGFSWYKGLPTSTPNDVIANLGNYFPVADANGDGGYTPATTYTLTGDANLVAGASPYLSQLPGNSNIAELFLAQPLTENTFTSVFQHDTNCQDVKGDPNKLVCNLTVTTPDVVKAGYNQSGILPVVLYNGLRARTVEEMIRNLPAYNAPDGTFVAASPNRWDADNNQIDNTYPDLMEISAEPSDFNTATPVVNLSQYFSDPATNNQESFSFDSSVVADGSPEAQNCNNVRITRIDTEASAAANPGVPAVTCADNNFSIDGNGNLVAQGLTNGIYQINVKATAGNESAWQSFYLNVNAANPNLAAWRTGAVATTNIIGSFPSVYVYSGQDPDNAQATGWPSDFVSYGKDIQYVNANFLPANPIKSVLAEMISMQYGFTDPTDYKLSHWQLAPPTGSDNDPADEFVNGPDMGITTDRSNTLGNWIGTLIDPSTGFFANPTDPTKNVGLTLNFDFTNGVKGDFMSFNPTEQSMLANTLVEPILYAQSLNPNYKVDGLALDLEASFNEPTAAETFKQITDRLAYHGKWLQYFAFPEMFNPDVVAAFGPLGVGNISTYDIAESRAPQTSASAAAGMIAYDNPLFGTNFNNATEASQLYAAFLGDSTTASPAGLCDDTVNSNNGNPLPYPAPVSWCNASVNDSVSENNRRFTEGGGNNGYGVSPEGAIEAFHGNYSLSLPAAGSATQWSSVEIWNPDFSLKPAQNSPAAVTAVIAPAACTSITNAFIASNEASLDTPTATSGSAYQEFADCLNADVYNPADIVSGTPGVSPLPVTVQTYSHCGNEPSTETPIPYSQCIMVSDVAGKGKGDADVGHPSEAEYVANNFNVYNTDDPSNDVGYAIYALQNPASSHPLSAGEYHAGINASVQEPWYLGYNYTPSSNPVQDGQSYDPAYNESANNTEWSAIAAVVGNQ